MTDEMKILPYTKEDPMKLVVRDKDKWMDGDFLKKFADQHAERGVGYTVWNNGIPVMCGGVDLYWPRVGEVWLLLSDWAIKHPLILLRASTNGLNTLIKGFGIKRCQATIKANDKVAIRFCEAHKFKREGLMRSYGPDGSDYYMYGRVE